MSRPNRSPRVIVLGAKGVFGRYACQAFAEAGWAVTALARGWDGHIPAGGATAVTGDAADPDRLAASCAGQDAIVNAVNVPYPQWATKLPGLTDSVIAAARASGATVLIPGNVYHYGTRMPAVLDEATPVRPATKKGRLRAEMEASYARAANRGVTTVVLRGGDFIHRERAGNWFDTYIAGKVGQGKAMYPGPRDVRHAWAYVPDMARAMAALAQRRSTFSGFNAFGFGGYAFTGNELIQAMQHALGRRLKVTGMPWPLIRAIGVVNPMMREVAEMAYLWRVPHEIDGSRLAATIPEFRPTPPMTAIRVALGVAPLPAAAARPAA